jgi:predicted acyltransferase
MWLEIFDPEGWLGLIPAVATALLGMLTGMFVRTSTLSGSRKTLYMLGGGIVLALIGQLWNLSFPINKNLWSSSFVCFAGGLSVVLFAVFYYITDVQNYTRWAFPFRIIGLNSITVYLASILLNISFIAHALFGGITNLFPAAWNEMLTGFFYAFTCWLLLYFLYRQKIFLKV